MATVNNWHRKMYGLDPSPSPLYMQLLKAGAANAFWLEPGVYAGAPKDVAELEVVSNSLCYRAQFDGADMLDLWRGLEFYPRGTDALTIDGDGNPDPDANDPQRLQAQTEIGGQPAVVTLYLVPASSSFLVNVQITAQEGGGGGGWGGGHTF